MRPIHAAAALAAALGLAGCAGQVDEREMGAADPTFGQLATIDEDADGFITPDEMSGHYRSAFTRADLNRDTRLSGAEIGPETGVYGEAEAMGMDPAAPDFELGMDDYLAARESEFDAADLDGDGRVSRAEFERHIAGR